MGYVHTILRDARTQFKMGSLGAYRLTPRLMPETTASNKLSELVRSLKYLEVKQLPLVRPDGVTVSNVQIRMKRVV